MVPEMSDTRLLQVVFWGLCCTMYTCVASHAGDPAAGEWTHVRRDGDVNVYLQPAAGPDIPAVRGHTLFPAPVSTVFRVISDYDHFAGFIPLVSESRVLERDARTTWVYQRLDLPLPVADRHYIIRVDDELPVPGREVMDVGWQLDRIRSESLPANTALLPDAFSGSWHLKAVNGGSGCDALYTVHVDPGGVLPHWLFVRVTERYVVQVMDAVRRRIAAERR